MLDLSPYEIVVYYYLKLAQNFYYTPADIDNIEISLMFDMFYVAGIEEKAKPKEKARYIDEVMP